MIQSWTPAVRRLMDKRLWVLGYISEDFPGDSRAVDSICQYGAHLDTYVDFAFQMHFDGCFTGEINQPALTESLNHGIAPLILFHNFNGRIFDPAPLRAVLSSTTTYKSSIRQLLSLLPDFAAGVQIDFEGVEAAYRIPFLSFLESLRADLHERGLLLTVAIPAKRSEWEAPGYDFAGIGRLADIITLMTYDEHFSGGSAGAIAGLPWMTQTLDYALRYLPMDKVLLGIPAYGYDWSAETSQMVAMRDIPHLAARTKARMLWSDEESEPHFCYWQGRSRHNVWFESELSAKIRLSFVKNYRLRGIAIWRLGYETNRFWQGVATKLKK